MEATLLKLAKGSYQRGLLLGQQRWSGADLRGRAQKWSAGYYRSRMSLLSRIQKAGIDFAFVGGTASTGPKTLVFGEEARDVKRLEKLLTRGSLTLAVILSAPEAEIDRQKAFSWGLLSKKDLRSSGR